MWFQNSRHLLFLALATAPWVPLAMAQGPMAFQAVNLDATLSPDMLAAQLAARRVVFVGETHDRYDHHLNQLEIVRGVHQLDPGVAIGVEYLEQRFQPQVDDYIAGRITEEEFLRGTEYYQEWGYDYRLYAPIFRFAREQRIPVRALNVPVALASAVAKVGVAGLTAQQHASLPEEIAPADEDYRSRLREAFAAHGAAKPQAFDHFVEAQLVWDESMAANAAAYLNANPGRRIVILAGSGHLAFGSGIPKRLERRTHATYAIVLNGAADEDVGRHMADYLLLSRKQELPPPGILGVSLQEENGECRIRSLSPNGAGEKAGLTQGDVLVEIDGQTIKRIADLHLALWDRKPGDRVRVSVRRVRHFGGVTVRNLEIELTAPGKPQGD
jgi:uncharacterized iron-regulated protein